MSVIWVIGLSMLFFTSVAVAFYRLGRSHGAADAEATIRRDAELAAEAACSEEFKDAMSWRPRALALLRAHAFASDEVDRLRAELEELKRGVN